MMNNKQEFQVKKKKYHTPVLKKYGTLAEYTKGSLTGQGNPDGQQYYGSDLRS